MQVDPVDTRPEGDHPLTQIQRHSPQQDTHRSKTSTPPHPAAGSIPAPRAPHEAPTVTSTDQEPETQRLAAYIRHIANTARPPTPAQLERLAGLLRDTGNPSPPR
jgi:hypothetical protein